MEEDTADSHKESVDEVSIGVDRGEKGGAVGAHLEQEKEDDDEGDELAVMKDEVDVSLNQLILLLVTCLS